MTFRTLTAHKLFRPAAGVVIAVICGLVLGRTPTGENLVNASYDSLFQFGTRSTTNKLVLVVMDNVAFSKLDQKRGNLWNRALHAELLTKLKADGCPLVIFDVFFRDPSEPAKDEALAEAMRQHGRVVLMTKVGDIKYPGTESFQVLQPYKLFLDAVASLGVGRADAKLGEVVRRHWQVPAAGEAEMVSLPWAAAQLAGARLGRKEEVRWLRYYGQKGGWDSVSYHLALSNAPGYFRDKTVIIGQEPERKLDTNYREEDKFRSPYSRWNSEAIGGVEVMATTFLNLMNNDSLRRSGVWAEVLLFTAAGILIGGGLTFIRPLYAILVSAGVALLLGLAAACVSYFSNWWFPWLVVVGGQVPCALAWALVPARTKRVQQTEVEKPALKPTIHLNLPEEQLPDAPEYEVVTPEIGKGGFGKVWIARNAIGQWQALKAVYESSFGGNRGPYEAEFKGLQKYKPVSEKHPGLLRIDLVSKMKHEGYFYYVMELGDAQAPGWEKQPTLYKPNDLENMRRKAYGRRLPPKECVRIVTVLADALNFLHQQGLAHRDIKPSNVIFVNGRPKLADIGLVADIRPLDQIHTMVGTMGYMPPSPEKPGTPQADIYALGMLLYVISTGRDPDSFPNLSTTLMERSGHTDFLRLNAVILKACQPDTSLRYASAAEMHVALKSVFET